jgi:hypothetical protein
MNLRVLRATGNPIEPEHIEQFKQEFKILYDRVLGRIGLTERSVPTPEQAARADRILQRCERLLLRKYPSEAKWPFMQSFEEVRERVKKYGAVAVLTDPETQDLVYVILDVPLS